MVTRQEFTQGNATARAETIRQRTRDRKQQEAMIAAEMAIQAAVPIVEEVFDPARSEIIIKRFQACEVKEREVMPVLALPILAPPPERDDTYLSVRERWLAKVAAARSA